MMESYQNQSINQSAKLNTSVPPCRTVTADTDRWQGILCALLHLELRVRQCHEMKPVVPLYFLSLPTTGYFDFRKRLIVAAQMTK